MLDNLRESASQSPFFQEEQTPPEQKPSPGRKEGGPGNFMGMTPVQRFVVALMLFLMVCVFGSFILLATEKIWLGG
jgi:ABC-type Na+ efflux pump permease subunit